LKQEPRYYILVGDEKTWNASFSENVWGFSETSKGLWNTTNMGDFVAFYAITPIKKIMGFGVIEKKVLDETIFWPDEKLFQRSIWKYRIRFRVLHKIQNWNDGIRVPNHIMLNVGRKVVNRETFSILVKDADLKWKTSIYTKVFKK
jgi:hypothetical protein